MTQIGRKSGNLVKPDGTCLLLYHLQRKENLFENNDYTRDQAIGPMDVVKG